MYLRGSKLIVYQDEEGEIKHKQVNTGYNKTNEEGVQTILNWVQMIINSQVAQGNFPSDKTGRSPIYEDFVCDARINLTYYILLNCYRWQIQDDDIEGMVDSIMNIIEPFMTRLIDNKERESYGQSLRHIGTSTVQDKGGFNLFSKS